MLHTRSDTVASMELQCSDFVAFIGDSVDPSDSVAYSDELHRSDFVAYREVYHSDHVAYMWLYRSDVVASCVVCHNDSVAYHSDSIAYIQVYDSDYVASNTVHCTSVGVKPCPAKIPTECHTEPLPNKLPT